MYSRQKLKEILEEGDSGFLYDLEWQDLKEILEGWEEEVAALQYQRFIETDYSATRMK